MGKKERKCLRAPVAVEVVVVIKVQLVLIIKKGKAGKCQILKAKW